MIADELSGFTGGFRERLEHARLHREASNVVSRTRRENVEEKSEKTLKKSETSGDC
jgi:hypothetical protein